jgi:RNA recognition motif-containing protein
MQNQKKGRKRLHVSNIPYELKEEDLIDLFSSMGPVLDCERIYDKTTNKFKGSAKIEYPDYYTVKAALRNLNRYEIKGRFLKLNFANSDKFPSEKNEMINEDELSDPEEFESKHAEKDFTEVVTSLQNSQKYFLLEELKHLCESNEEEFRNMLKQDEKIAQTLLSIQRDLKLDRAGQNPSRNVFEEEAIRNQNNYPMMSGGRPMNDMMGQPHQLSNNGGPFNKRIQAGNKGQNLVRRMNPRDSSRGLPGSRMNQNYMNFEGPNTGGMQMMRGPEGQPFYPNNEPRQFNPNLNQPNLNKNKMFYNPGNRMY